MAWILRLSAALFFWCLGLFVGTAAATDYRPLVVMTLLSCVVYAWLLCPFWRDKLGRIAIVVGSAPLALVILDVLRRLPYMFY